jgi:uncharacterized protein YraI
MGEFDMGNLVRTGAAVALAAGLVLGAGAAQAAPGHASVAANVRSGPGLGFHVVDVLHPGEYVIVLGCNASWCEIHHIGPDGWVARSLLYNPYYGSRHYYQFRPRDLNQPGRGVPVGR